MNFARDFVDRQAGSRTALIEIDCNGVGSKWSFARLTALEAAIGQRMHALGVTRGRTVVTVVGNRPEWVAAIVACFRIGAVAVPCNEQLRASDLRHRIGSVGPALIIADERNRAELTRAEPGCPILWLAPAAQEPLRSVEVVPPAAAELDEEDPCLIIFTSGTTGSPKPAVHAQRYLWGQRLQAEQWFGAARDSVAWCTAASGWSKSARNVFLAPWLCGAAALLHDGRFDPERRLDLIEREHVATLCMSPTEYRVIARRAKLRPIDGLRELVAAGEALDPETISTWKTATGLEIRDGYGQTETGALTSNVPGEPVVAGSMGRALDGVRLWIEDGELVVDPATVQTFFTGYLDEPEIDRAQPWRTGDRVVEHEGRFFFETRNDDLIISAGYRIGPEEVEAVLCGHPAVSDAAVIGAPDADRGQIVRAIVQLAPGYSPSAELVAGLQAHCKAVAAPYKYPRLIEFSDVLPRTASGKLQRAFLR